MALKVAADRGQGDALSTVCTGALTVWGVTAIASWALSAVLSMMVLSQTGLSCANSISSIRYVLICLAATRFLGEPMTVSDGIGVAPIAAGLLFVGKA